MKFFTTLFCIASLLTILSCGLFSPPDHELRIKNDATVILNLDVGPVAFGNIVPGTVTSYKSIDEGTHEITGDVDSTQTNELTVNGNGHHKWTMTVDADLKFSLKEDE